MHVGPLKIVRAFSGLAGLQFEGHLHFVLSYFFNYAAGGIVLPSTEYVEMQLSINSARPSPQDDVLYTWYE